MSDDKHNGWTNYETWMVALQITSNEGWSDAVCTEIENASMSADHPLDAREIGLIIRENVERVFDFEEATIGMGTNAYVHYVKGILPILKEIGSLWRVNWDELGADLFE